MTRFAEAIYQYWQEPFTGHTVYSDEHLSISVNPALDADEGVTILHTISNTHTYVALLPDIAHALRTNGTLDESALLTEHTLRLGLRNLGIVMHGADHLYYLPNSLRESWLLTPQNPHIRQLTEDDAMLFSNLEYHTTDQELDQAQVALDDWAVFGVTDNNQLVSAASIYPWGNTNILDIGVLTLATARGKGHATRLLRAVGQYVMSQSGELQYRSQADNLASIALAEASGLALFGYWEIPTPNNQE